MAEIKQLKPSNNPGLTDKAWKELHQKLIKYNMKYRSEIQINRMRGEKKSG